MRQINLTSILDCRNFQLFLLFPRRCNLKSDAMKKLVVLTLLLTFFPFSYGQYPEIYFERITEKQGLFDQTTTCIIQDKSGFMWIGGLTGLYKYDGYHCTYFKYPPGCSNCAPFGAVHSLQEDDFGNIWILSRDALILFNPEKEKSCIIQQYFSSYSILNIAFNSGFDLLLDTEGNVWCTDTIGLLKISYKSGIKKGNIQWNDKPEKIFNITHIDLSSEILSNKNVVLKIYEDNNGNIWIGCRDGLYILRKGNNIFYDLSLLDKTYGISYGFCVYDILQFNADTFLLITTYDDHILRNVKKALHEKKLDMKAFVLERIRYTEVHGTTKWFKDREKNTLLAASNGAYLLKSFDKNSRTSYRNIYKNLEDQHGNYFEQQVYFFYADRTNLLWAGQQYYGLLKFKLGRSNFTGYKNLISNRFTSLDINSIYKDDNDNLWIGSWGGGIYKIEEVKSRIKKYDPGSPDNLIYTFAKISNDVFWVGKAGFLYGVLEFNSHTGKYSDPLPDSETKQVLMNSRVWDLLKDGKLIYMATTRGLFVYDLEAEKLYHFSYHQQFGEPIPRDYYRSLIKLKNGEIWVGNDHHGINKVSFNTEKGEISLSQVVADSILKEKDINLEDYFRLFQDSRGILWLVNKKGLYSIDPKNKEIILHNLLETNEFPEARSILEDNRSNLWIGTHSGLCKYERKTGKVKCFTREDGLPITLHGYNSAFKDKDGRLFFGGLGGFYSFYPDSIRTNNCIPSIVITDFRLFNKSIKVDTSKKGILDRNISFTKIIDLAHNQNDIAFTFAALDYNQPLKNKYAYKLEGYQDAWIETDADNRIATYTNLNPGEYVFRVKGSNNDGVWNEEGTFIKIFIHPPFWKTTWAYIAYGILFLLMLRGYIYLHTRQLTKEKISLERQVSERTEELQEVNTLLEEQKEELLQQKEELQTTLENLQKTQEQLIESEKLAALGGLVAGVAHEINTPVGIGVTAVSNLREEIQEMAALYKKDEISRKDFKEFLELANDSTLLIQKNLQRTADLVQSFKQVSADQVSEQQRVFNIRAYLDDIIRSLYPKFKQKRIEFNIECDDNLELNSYPGAFAQVFTNLLLNSYTHGFHDRQLGMITIHIAHKEGMLKIKYQDDGVGISRKDLPHIFEPFYTTDQSRGTGLGLNIVYNIIKQKLLGTVSCNSNPEEGVLFTIELPAIIKTQTHGK
jgi:signal transduction histidine kinase/ligand-binding sensor domain-containing protein